MPLFRVTREVVYNEDVLVEAESKTEAEMDAENPHFGRPVRRDPVETERVKEVRSENEDS